MGKGLVFGAVLLALAPAPAPAAQDTEVKGARASLVKRPAAVVNVTIENRRESPLVAWQIGLTAPGGSYPRETSWSDYSGRSTASPANGPIKPHEHRLIRIDLVNDLEASSAALRLALFDDGYYEGIPAAVDPWLKDRKERVDDLRFWNGVLELMPRVSEKDLRAYLGANIAERAGRIVMKPNAPGVSVRLQEVLRHDASGPDVWSGLDRLRAETRDELAAVTRQPPSAATSGGPVTSAAIVSQDRAISTNLSVTIENLRDVPIEAFGFRIRNGSGSISGQTRDACLSDPGSTSSGSRIRPHESREIPLYQSIGADEPLPAVTMTFVLFDDLFSEGKIADRDELFRARELRADDFAFAVTVLGQVTGQPAADVQTFLMGKRAERTAQLQAAGTRGLHTLELDELIRQAKDSPERLLANATAMRGIYQRNRDKLLRHQRR